MSIASPASFGGKTALEIRIDEHEKAIQALKEDLKDGVKGASVSRKELHAKIDGVDKRVTDLVINGQKQVIITMVGFIISLILIGINLAFTILR